MSGDPSQTAATETRRLAAIMFTDIAGFSRQMGADEARMLRLLDVHNRVIQQTDLCLPDSFPRSEERRVGKECRL